MGSMSIRNLDTGAKERLRISAKREGRSMTVEPLDIRALSANEPPWESPP